MSNLNNYKLYKHQEEVVEEGMRILSKYNMLYLALEMRY